MKALDGNSGWTFLSNHGHVLVCIAKDPDIRVRDIALQVGITERAIQRILLELEEAKVIQKIRQGRCNHYQINTSLPLRHPIEENHTIGILIQTLSSPKKNGSKRNTR